MQYILIKWNEKKYSISKTAKTNLVWNNEIIFKYKLTDNSCDTAERSMLYQ